MNYFWNKLPSPFFVLAPMYEVTDTAYRRMFVACGRPDVFMTEFVNVDGLAHPASHEKMKRYYLPFSESERPIVMQIWGSNPDNFYKAGQLARELGFDGVDINMGCPDKKVMSCGGGSALIGNKTLVTQLLQATKEGSGLPVSVKTRMGITKDITEEWMLVLKDTQPAAITLHARLAKDMSRVPANWTAVKRAAQVLAGSNIPLIGNGDVKSRKEGELLAATHFAQGVMVGRGVFGNYWFFVGRDAAEIPASEKLRAAVMHAQLFEKNFSGVKRFHMMYKHLASAATGFAGAKELRSKLMRVTTAAETGAVVEEFLASHT